MDSETQRFWLGLRGEPAFLQVCLDPFAANCQRTLFPAAWAASVLNPRLSAFMRGSPSCFPDLPFPDQRHQCKSAVRFAFPITAITRDNVSCRVLREVPSAVRLWGFNSDDYQFWQSRSLPPPLVSHCIPSHPRTAWVWASSCGPALDCPTALNSGSMPSLTRWKP